MGPEALRGRGRGREEGWRQSSAKPVIVPNYISFVEQSKIFLFKKRIVWAREGFIWAPFPF